jgi:hypothetical protein
MQRGPSRATVNAFALSGGADPPVSRIWNGEREEGDGEKRGCELRLGGSRREEGKDFYYYYIHTSERVDERTTDENCWQMGQTLSSCISR